MKIFVTGASGWVGSAAIPALIEAGHEVIGLARSDAAAARVEALGATVLRGELDDLASLRAGAEQADAVVHLAFKHDFSDYAGAGRTEHAAITTLGDALVGTDKPLLFASGLAGLAPGRVATENDIVDGRGGAEALARGYAERGVRTVALRFAPTVHGEGDHGFMSTIVGVARAKGVSGYVGDGANRWPAAARTDIAGMIVLALEKAPAGSVVHGVGEEGISTKAIAEAIGRELGLPVESISAENAADHFGWIGMFFGADIPASSALTQQLLGWTPTGPSLFDDLPFYTR